MIATTQTSKNDAAPPSTYTSTASMYQTAAYKTLAQIRIHNKRTLPRDRIIGYWCGAYQGENEGEALGHLGISSHHVPVTLNEQLLREQGKITNYCYKASMLRASWTHFS